MLGNISTYTPDVDNLLNRYKDLVKKANLSLNLVSRHDVDNLIQRLAAESLLPLDWQVCRIRSPLLDIGSGAGFPGIPLKLARPDLAVTLLDSNRRKTTFLRTAIRELALDRTEAVCARAESLLDRPGFTGQYRTVVSRGIANLEEVLHWAAEFLKSGGEVILWKGSNVSRELDEADTTGWSTPQFLHQPSGLTLVRMEVLEG